MRKTVKEIETLQAYMKGEYKYYKPIPFSVAMHARQDYLDSLPAGMLIQGNKNCRIYTKDNTLIACGYTRMVLSDYGILLEFSPKQAIQKNIMVKKGQEYRINGKYAENVKYHWLTANDNSDIKIFYQIKTVPYGDYKPKMYYVNPYDVKIRYERSSY